MITLSTTFPRLVYVDDRCEFEQIANVLQHILGHQIIVNEVDFIGMLHVGVASVDTPASDEEIEFLLKNAGITR